MPITSSPERTLSPVRAAVLDAATTLLAQRGFGGLRMVDVAAEVGVSRQTVHNEFGNKQALVQAVALRTTAEFLDGVVQRLASTVDILDGIRAATVFIVEHAAENPIVASMLGGSGAEDLLPFVTTRGRPVLRACAEVAATHLLDRLPGLSRERADQLGEGLARLTISHLLLSTGDAQQAADSVLALIAPAIAAYSSTETVHTEPPGGMS